MSEIDRQIQKLRNAEHISEIEISQLCYKAREIFIEEPNVLQLDAPIVVNE